MNVLLQREHRLRFLTPLPDTTCDNGNPHKGQVFKSVNCCLTLMAVLGIGVEITILVVAVGRNLGAGIGFGAGLGFGCPPITLFCIVLAIDLPPPHPPQPIIF